MNTNPVDVDDVEPEPLVDDVEPENDPLAGALDAVRQDPEIVDFTGKTCQETTGMVGDQYIRCGAPAVMLVKHRGRSEGPYYMCLEDGTHNARNRNAEVLATVDVPAVADDVEPESAPVAAVALMQVLPADFSLPALIKFVPDLAIKKRLEDAVAYALSIVVEGPEGIQRADLALGALTEAIKVAEAHFEEPAAIANQLHKYITGLRAEWANPGKHAKDTVGRRVWSETNRLQAEAAEVRRLEQERANKAARAAAEKEAAAAAKAGAPTAVVEQLKEEAKTAQAPPVTQAAPPVMRSVTTTTTWKARIKGTLAEAEPNPAMSELTPVQRANVLALMKAVIDGKEDLTNFELNWKRLNALAKGPDKSALNILGIEAFKDGGVRAKGTRSR